LLGGDSQLRAEGLLDGDSVLEAPTLKNPSGKSPI